MILSGKVDAPDFPDWICHRARRLGLKGWVKARDNPAGNLSLEIFVFGPTDLVDAMELGCSLGPMSVSVDHIDRSLHDVGYVPNGFSILQFTGQPESEEVSA